MPRTATVVLLLLVPTTARADGGAPFPGYRSVWVDFIFTVEQDYPDYEFYLFSAMEYPTFTPERLPLTPSNPVKVSGSGPGPDEDIRYKWDAKVYAVPKSRLAGLTGPPSREWFEKYRDRFVLLKGEELGSRSSLPFTDNRHRIEITYRIEVGPEGGHLVKVGENAGNPWVKRGWLAAGIFISLGIIGLGLRWMWRVCRPRKVLS